MTELFSNQLVQLAMDRPSLTLGDMAIAAVERPKLLAEMGRLREVVEMIAKAELYDPATGIIDADVLEAVQEAARSALAGN